jgi:outer membrane protein OmpA-like peptidoglycan-associated protein
MKTKSHGWVAAACAAALAISVAVGCTSAKPVSTPAPRSDEAVKPIRIAPGFSIIQTDSKGFSPTAENAINSIYLSLHFANANAVQGWKVEIADAKATRKTISGTGVSLPQNVAWDGKDDGGLVAADGKYSAALSIDYGEAYKPEVVTSNSFILDSTPPTGSISLSHPYFSPMETKDRETISIAGKSNLAKLDSWSLEIYDPGENLFKTFAGKWPDSKIVWDGRGFAGDMVVSTEDYPVVLKIRDQLGNVGIVKSVIPIDILVTKQGRGYRITNSRVYFKDFTADYKSVDPPLAAQNQFRLDQLAEKLKKFPGYKVKIIGHAVMIHWDDPAQGKIEQQMVLLPLSQARADAVKQAMVDRGINPAMITAQGVGAAEPLVPDSEYANRWRNRRTALFLDN